MRTAESISTRQAYADDVVLLAAFGSALDEIFNLQLLNIYDAMRTAHKLIRLSLRGKNGREGHRAL